MEKKDICIYLIEHGIKPSYQRIVLMKYLLTHRTHPDIEEIYNALNSEIPTLSKTTVYNTMKLFTEHKVAVAINIDEHQVRFDGEMRPHGHFLCQKCGNIIDFDLKDKTLTKIETIAGSVVFDTQIYCKGICPECIKKIG